MCGIAGILNGPGEQPVSFDVLRRMAAMLRHRGPDGYGMYRDQRIGLAHTRLSIIDLTAGDQPIHNEDENVWVTYNGEIFNYRELRKTLEERGHRFYTRSDTEVIVHCYEEYGEAAWRMFNGQFALALWDRKARKLWLVRDRVGIVPLYYCLSDGRLLFASEAKALFASGYLQPGFNAAGLVEVFSRWAASAPRTVFRGVQNVEPGTSIVFNEGLQARSVRYWQADFSEAPGSERLTLDEAVEGLDEHLRRSIRLRLRADVPVGAYLSGGLDSSVIAQLARNADSSPLQTFAVRFRDPAFDETVEQRRMAALLGTRHHEILCGEDELRDALPDVVWHCESPLLRTAPTPLYLLSSLVRQNQMKVVLTGEGADELLAGYDIFKEDKVRRFWARQPESTWRPRLFSRLYHYVGEGRHQQTRLWQHFFRKALEPRDHPFYSHMVRWQNTGWATLLLAPELVGKVDPFRIEADLEASMPPGWRTWSPLGRAQMTEVTTFMSAYLLSSQGDRVAMGHSVEARYPFLDPELVDFCARLPARLKLRGLRDKVTLRALARRDLPREIWDRPKQPYRAPMTRAFFGNRTPAYVDDLLSPQALKRLGLVNSGAVSKLVLKARRRDGHLSSEREEMALVGVLTLQLLGHFYLESFCERATAAHRELEGVPPSIFVDHSRVNCSRDGNSAGRSGAALCGPTDVQRK